MFPLEFHQEFDTHFCKIFCLMAAISSRQWPEVSDFVVHFCTLSESEAGAAGASHFLRKT